MKTDYGFIASQKYLASVNEPRSCYYLLGIVPDIPRFVVCLPQITATRLALPVSVLDYSDRVIV